MKASARSARGKFPLARLGLVGFAALMLLILSSAVSATNATVFAAQGKENKANVVVQFDTNDVAVRGITFTTKKIPVCKRCN